MNVDLRNHTVVWLSHATKLVAGEGGKPIHISSLIRAINKGVNGQKLSALRIGRRWATSIECMQDWAERVTAASTGQQSPPASVSRRKAADRAGKQLSDRGI
jgi:hypothetical protein